MARPREFDREKTLQKAMHLFWRQGYEATSIQDLVCTLGLKPGSIYNAFNDKRSLYLEALDCYQRQESAQVCALLDANLAPIAALRQIFLAVIDADLADSDLKGCMLINAAAELAMHDDEVRARVAAARGFLQDAFYSLLLRAKGAGELGAEKDPQALAAFLVNGLFGLRITAKVLRERSALVQMVDMLLAALD